MINVHNCWKQELQQIYMQTSSSQLNMLTHVYEHNVTNNQSDTFKRTSYSSKYIRQVLSMLTAHALRAQEWHQPSVFIRSLIDRPIS